MLDLQLMIENYISYCREQNQFTERSIERYNYLLHVYYEFLCKHNDININTLHPYMSGVKPEDIFQSLEYYIDNYPVNSEDTAHLYISVIKEFYRYLFMFKIVNSSNLIVSFGLKDTDPNSFSFKLNEFLRELYKRNKIIIKSEDTIISDDNVAKIIECCNKNLILSEIKRLPDKKDSYNRFVKALIVKLILLTGIKFTPTIKSIKKKDLNLGQGTLKIEKYQIHLPYHYRKQLNDYTTIYNCKSDEDPLFSFYNNSQLSQPNDLTTIFSRTVDITKTTSLAKYAIISMIDAGLDKETILDFTGYGEQIYNSCNEISNVGISDKKIQLLDNKIKCLDIFDVL